MRHLAELAGFKMGRAFASAEREAAAELTRLKATGPQTEGENVCPECDGHCTDYSGSFACDTCSGKGKEKA